MPSAPSRSAARDASDDDDDDDDDDDEEKKMKPWGPADEALTKKLRVAQFQLLGAAMMRKATMEERAEGVELLQRQLLLARREAAVAVAVAEGHERALVAKGSGASYTHVFHPSIGFNI